MVKVLVHVHVYYIKAWFRIEKILQNIVAEKSVEVKILTTVSSDLSDSDIYTIEKSRVKGMSLIRMPNNGYDIQPFFFLLQSVDLEDYNYIIKLHTKRVQHGIDVFFNGRFISRVLWSKFLINAIAGSTGLFKKNLERMQLDQSIGMIGSCYLLSAVSSSDEEEKKMICNYVHKLNAENVTGSKYIAGTMFMVRSDILKPLIDSALVYEEFERSESGKLGGTKAHAIERILGVLVSLHNKRICGFDKSWWNDFVTGPFAHVLRRFTFDKRITSNGRLLIRIFRIPVYNAKYPKK